MFLFSLLLLPPIFRAFISLLFAGAAFPLAGVMVLRMNLLQLRYTLMHGLLLGGALALALDLPSIPVYVLMCTLTVILILLLSRKGKLNMGISSAFLMVLSVALAAIITQAADVPSKDTLELLWGSPFTVQTGELAAFAVLSLLIILYTVFNFRTILLVFFDRDVALSSGKNISLHETVMVFLIAFAVALSMRFVGSLLIDALLILPSVIALKIAGSIRKLFITASLMGLLTAVTGFMLSLVLDMPPSSMIAASSALIYILIPHRKEKSL